jgi:hypothetical protein
LDRRIDSSASQSANLRLGFADAKGVRNFIELLGGWVRQQFAIVICRKRKPGQ